MTIPEEKGTPGPIVNQSTGKTETGYHSDFKKTVTVYSTSKDKFHKTGDPIKVHVNQVAGLIERGLVTKDEPKKKEVAKKEGE